MTRTGMTLLLAGLLLNGGAVEAGQLDKDSCDKLEQEQTKLEQAGVRNTIAKGPQWGKANLPLDKLQEVRRLIEVDEMLTFRCQGKPLVLLPSSVDADPPPTPDDKADTGKEGEAAPKAPKEAPKAAPPVKKAAVPEKAELKKVEPKKAEPKKAEPKAETVKKAAAPPVTKEPAKTEPKKDDAGQVTVAKPKAPPPKKKVDDAYKPPPQVEPGENPFTPKN